MSVYDIRTNENIRLIGRFDRDEAGFTMSWSGSCAEILVRAPRLDITIECKYAVDRRPYISFEVDGLRAQTFSPLEGIHEYTVFLGMRTDRAHHVRIIKECQNAFDGTYVKLLSVRTDGELLPLPKSKRRIEFIGDSISAGEGCRGPVAWDEWLPMMFSCSDNYTTMTADRLKAEFQVVALSGWGVVCGWNNNPDNYIPRIYNRITPDSEKPYDFSFDPDTVVIALGTNDNNALKQPPFMDPETGKEFALRVTDADMQRETEAACAFVKEVHRVNPNAKIVWISFFEDSPALTAISNGVEKAASSGIDVSFHKVLDLANLPRGGMGARFHPGIVSHRHITKELVKILRNR